MLELQLKAARAGQLTFVLAVTLTCTQSKFHSRSIEVQGARLSDDRDVADFGVVVAYVDFNKSGRQALVVAAARKVRPWEKSAATGNAGSH